jgi:hypothetical protein
LTLKFPVELRPDGLSGSLPLPLAKRVAAVYADISPAPIADAGDRVIDGSWAGAHGKIGSQCVACHKQRSHGHDQYPVHSDISRCPTWLVAGACRFTGLNAVLKKLHFRESVGFGRACPPFRTTTCSLGGLQVAQAARAITAQWNG